MATLASALVLAKIKHSYIESMNQLTACADEFGYGVASQKAIEIAEQFGFAKNLSAPGYALAMIGMNTNHGYSYVEDTLKDLNCGYNSKTGNCCFENTMRSHLILPNLLNIYDEIAESYVIITVDETRHSIVAAKNTEDLRSVYWEYANEYMDILGFEENLETSREKQFIYHPNFDNEESYLTHLLHAVK